MDNDLLEQIEASNAAYCAIAAEWCDSGGFLLHSDVFVNG